MCVGAGAAFSGQFLLKSQVMSQEPHKEQTSKSPIIGLLLRNLNSSYHNLDVVSGLR